MDVNRILFWIHLIAQAIVDILEALPGDGEESLGDPDSGFKPERIQFWLKLIARFVLAVFSGVREETGKSGEPPQSGGADSAVDW